MRILGTGSSVPKIRRNKRRSFSLIELVVVLAIMGLVTGVAVGRLGKRPVWASREKTLTEVERFFSLAAHLAAVRGRSVTIAFSASEKMFYVNENVENANEQYLSEKYHRLFLPASCEIRFETATEDILFSCASDGTCSGPTMILDFENISEILSFSPLTGQLRRKTLGN